ncbi:tail completion protein gp17 [Paenibacillus antarcticus]|uniref:DUF3168 domain-containing protein n=1 Tax=Paenibacillus antarcticus TaxID=253703 RepID=A0A162QGX9_9BACL|nr:hypothetical protein [Paenibacillus antarcticus]OAB48460.1 hypothetical protein PBAT_02175 [Paenibacillus antarcticus]
MLIDLKPTITQALRNNSALVLLLGGKYVWPEVSPDALKLTYITFFELVNFDKLYASDVALNSEIHFQVDIWTPGNTGPIAQEVNKTMEEIGFTRSGSNDLFEKETKTYHKVLRYKTIKYGS